MSDNSLSERSDPLADVKLSWPLDMIAPIAHAGDGAEELLLDCWSGLAVHDLPPSVQIVALGTSPSWRSIVGTLLAPETVAYCCEAFLEVLHDQLPGGYRAVRIALARAGLTSDEVPTLEELARKWNITRERVRQIAQSVDVEDGARSVLSGHEPLRLDE